MPNSLTFNDLDIYDNGFTSSVLSDKKKKKNEILCIEHKKPSVHIIVCLLKNIYIFQIAFQII